MSDEVGQTIRYAVITLSDRSAAGDREDRSGPVAIAILEQCFAVKPFQVLVLPDERNTLESELIRLCDVERCQLIVTSGGTGLAPRDITPDATRAVIDREIPGMAEAMRAEGLKHTSRAMLSRAVCGQRGKTIIVNLSGSPKAVREQLAVIIEPLPHAIETASGTTLDCGR